MGRLREVSILFLICRYAWPAERVDPAPSSAPVVTSDVRVTVKVYNGVDLSSSELKRAEREAEKIFHYAGIQLTWSAGLLGADNDNVPGERDSLASLQLRIWRRAMAGRNAINSEALGFCLSFENGDAVVLADAIQKRAVFGTTNFTDLLGLAMVHELGHLLLRSPKHSVTGIMVARWSEKQLKDDDRGYLRFTPGEAESMRNEVRRRINLKSALEADDKKKDRAVAACTAAARRGHSSVSRCKRYM